VRSDPAYGSYTRSRSLSQARSSAPNTIGSFIDRSIHQSSSWAPLTTDSNQSIRQSYPSSKRLMTDSSASPASYLNPNTSSSVAMMGLAGNAEAEYYRLEEAAGKLHPELEAAILSMHDNLIQHSPKLLPLFRRLLNEIHIDRTRSLMEKSKLVGKLATKRSMVMNTSMTQTPVPLSRMAVPITTPSQKSSRSLSMSTEKNRFQRLQSKDKESRREVEGKIDFDSIKKRAKL
jgi:hypothetical protein